MSDNYGLVKWNTLHNIGDAIRNKTGGSDLFYPSEMADAINNINDGKMREPGMTSLMAYGTTYHSYYDHNGIFKNFYMTNNILFTNYIPEGVNILATEQAGSVFPCDIFIYEGTPLMLVSENSNFLGMCYNDIQNDIYLNNINVYNVYTNDINYVTPNLNDITATTIGGLPYYYKWTEENQWENLGLSMGDTRGYLIEKNNNVYYNTYEYCYGFGYDSSFNNNEFSFIDMSYMFNTGILYNYRGDAFCGNYTRYMTETYKSCGAPGIKTAVCGPNVISMRDTYRYCYNLVGSAACGDNVIDMANAYDSCSNLTTAVIGNKVENLSCAYNGCSNLIGDIIIPSSVKDLSRTFYNCGNLNSISGNTFNVEKLSGGFIDPGNRNNVYIDWDNFNWNSLKEVDESLYGENQFLINVNGFPSLISAYNMFYNCQNLVNIDLETNKLSNIRSMFYNCINLSQESYNNIINSIDNYNFYDGYQAFYNCSNIHDVYIKNCFANLYIQDMYLGIPIENVYWDEGIAGFGSVLANTNISQVYCPDSIINGFYMYDNCQNITTALCGNNVINMFHMYNGCRNITEAVCGPNVIDMSYAYSYCYNLTNAACGDNVTTMYQTYRSCNNLINAVCGNNVISMTGTYEYCYNLVNPVCGDNVIEMYSTYHGCNNLINAVCGNNVTSMSYTYNSCSNLSHAAIGPNVTHIYGTYRYCNNLIDDIELNLSQIEAFSYCFEECYKVKNILLKGDHLNYSSQTNAFALNKFNIVNRNIVILNRDVFNTIIRNGDNAFGNNLTSYLINNEKPLPSYVNVTVNGIEYEAVRLACYRNSSYFNGAYYYTYYNVYCTE